jgi:NAD(P)-dependent dehydrogenase (short-subunit alcohol dehydrogenase family)
MDEKLTGKVAIVTGAGAVIGPSDRPPVGNGKAAAILFAREGASVVAVDVNAEAAELTKRIIDDEGGKCSAFQADVSNNRDCRAIAEHCLHTYGRIDILHNNVGIGPPKPGGILEADEATWNTVINVNLKSALFMSQAVVPQMLAQGGGAILNISSLSAIKNSYPAFFIYSISKAGLNTLTQCLAFELADKGIRVNCIMPGMIDSPAIYKETVRLYQGNIDAMRKDRVARIPMKRMGEPWDIAKAALFLVSDQAKYITGQILAVDGGLSLTGG